MFKRIVTTISIGFIGLFLTAATAHAAVSVRLQQPKSPTNQSSFNLTFVTLDTEDNAVTVTCFKKGPSDAAFSQFGGPIVVSSGGNTDNCVVDSSIMNTEGTYSFKVTASNGSDPEVTSNVVLVDFNTSTPGTPTNYSKDKITACEYKIHFRSADDAGKTVKVEIYRSENKSFSADAGTRVGIIATGSNTDNDFTQSVPDCNKVYYYAVRAFDSGGNGSGVTGDSETVVTTNTINPTSAPQQQSAIPVAAAKQNSAVTTPQPTAETSVSPEPSTAAPETTTAPVDQQKGVQGISTKAETSSFFSVQNVLGFTGLILVVILGYWLMRRMTRNPHA